MTSSGHFGPELFRFLVELALNNNREWFQGNKARYESDVRDALVGFVLDFGERLRDVSTHYVADPRPVGGSIFRIYRDVRFARDKSPYKTQAAAHFRHEATQDNVHTPGYYLHLEPGNVFSGAGIWHPDSETLGKIRDAISANPVRWERIVSDKAMLAQHRIEGESLKRPPKGYDPDHPLIEDLKRKDFLVTRYYSEDDACTPEFIDRFTDSCKATAPYMEFLTRALGLPW